MKRFIMKSTIAIAAILLSLCLFTACSKKSDSTPDFSDHTKGSITFTSRGVDVSCTPDYNEALFHRTNNANYEREDFKILNVQGIKENGSHWDYKVVLQMITTGTLKKGTYSIIDASELGTYNYGVANPDDPTNVALGIVTDSKHPDHKRDVHSTGGGQLEITAITIGKHHPADPDEGTNGYTEGMISGTFKFTGDNLEHSSTGQCHGKFENIPLKISDDAN